MIFEMLRNKGELLLVERLYKQHKPLMLKMANEILHDRSLAEDAVEQSFVRVIDNLDKINENNCPETRSFFSCYL